ICVKIDRQWTSCSLRPERMAMLSLPIAFSSAIGVFAPVFSRPVWQHVKVLLTGAVLAPGQRTAAPVRCSHTHVVKASGLRWLACMVLTPLSWADRVWARPFVTALCPSERCYAQRGRRHQPLTARAWPLMRRVVLWLRGREIVCVADSSFAALELLDKVATLPRASVITRLRLDAALYAPPPHRAPGTIGRPRLTGKRRPTLEAVLADEKTPWTTLTVDDWYGEGPRAVEVATDTAVWSHTANPPVAIRWVLIRAPHERCKPQALLSTNLEHTCAQMLAWCVRRWTRAVACEA